jgi:RNA polymerase sigma-70 factor, ECF subfamily
MSGFADVAGAGGRRIAPTPHVESFESFYGREYRPVLALANVLIGDRAQAEDLAQEVFVAAFQSWATIANPGAWVRAAVSNKAMSWWRRTYAARRALARLGNVEPSTTDMTADADAFWGEVRRLPRRQAQAIALYYLEDLPVASIAAMLGCDASTVRIHLSRGRKALAARLEVAE